MIGSRPSRVVTGSGPDAASAATAGTAGLIAAAARRVIPPGACVTTDKVSFTLMANRFVSGVPGCPAIDDPTGVDLGVTRGLTLRTGAGQVPALVALWRTSFAHSQYVFLSNQSARRIPWTPGLLAFFHAPFAPALTWGAKGGVLYKRAGQ